MSFCIAHAGNLFFDGSESSHTRIEAFYEKLVYLSDVYRLEALVLNGGIACDLDRFEAFCEGLSIVLKQTNIVVLFTRNAYDFGSSGNFYEEEARRQEILLKYGWFDLGQIGAVPLEDVIICGFDYFGNIEGRTTKISDGDISLESHLASERSCQTLNLMGTMESQEFMFSPFRMLVSPCEYKNPGTEWDYLLTNHGDGYSGVEEVSGICLSSLDPSLPFQLHVLEIGGASYDKRKVRPEVAELLGENLDIRSRFNLVSYSGLSAEGFERYSKEQQNRVLN